MNKCSPDVASARGVTCLWPYGCAALGAMAGPLGWRSALRKVARSMLIPLAGATASAFSGGGWALTYPSGTIQSLFFSGDENFAVRVVLSGVADPCGENNGAFSYINASASNYKAYVAGLILAKAQGSRVVLTVRPGNANYCQLVEFMVQ